MNDYLDAPPRNPATINYNKEKRECPICLEALDNDPTCLACFHMFHYECILNWYLTLKSKVKCCTVCPTCNINGGLLPLRNGIEPISGVTLNWGQDIEALNGAFANVKIQDPAPRAIVRVRSNEKCKAIIKTKRSKNFGQQCNNTGRYNGYCAIHKGAPPP